MKPHLQVGIDVGYKTHRVAIADPDGNILEEFDISHTTAGFERFFARVEHHRRQEQLPVTKEVLQRVSEIPTANEKLKLLSWKR